MNKYSDLKKYFSSLFIYLIIAVPLQAQSVSSANINISATIPPSVSVMNQQDISFGTVLPGISETVNSTQGNAGRVKIIGSPGSEVFLSFHLPTHLTSGSDSLAVSFDKTSVAISETLTGLDKIKFGDPTTGFSARIGTGEYGGLAGELFLLLGCTVSPRSDQEAGYYSGVVQVTVIYTGN